MANRLGKIEKKAETTKDKEALKEVSVLKRIKDSLEKSIPVRLLEFTEDEIDIIKNFNLITFKKIIYVANVSEESASVGDNEYSLILKEYAAKEKASVVVMCAKLESDLADYPDEEKEAFLKDLGIANSGLDKLIFATYDLLGMKAPKCAGIIHSDFERGFIKAEVMSFDDLKELGSELKVKEAGRLRLEGKDYEVMDGDICYFRFNV